MKKFAIAGLIVGMMLIFSAGLALTAPYLDASPKLYCPSYVSFHSHFNKQYTLTYADYLAGKLVDTNVGTISVCGLSQLKLDVWLYAISGAGNATKAAQAFGVRETGEPWVDFRWVGDRGTIVDLGSTMAYTTQPIRYGWLLKELGSANAGKNITYKIRFMAVSY